MNIKGATSQGWVKELEVELTRKNKAKKKLKREIDERIERLRLIEEDTELILKKYLGAQGEQGTRGDFIDKEYTQ